MHISVVGDGAVGLCCALRCSQIDWKIALIGNSQKNLSLPLPEAGEFNARTYALNCISCDFLEHLGVLQTIPRFYKLNSMRLSAMSHSGKSDLIISAQDASLDKLGIIVEHNVLLQSLLAKIDNDKNIQRIEDKLANVSLTARPRRQENYQLALQSGGKIFSQALIAADGAKSSVRNWAKINWYQRDYCQTALSCTVELDRPHNAQAWQLFDTEDIIALLPISDRHATLIWSCNNRLYNQLIDTYTKSEDLMLAYLKPRLARHDHCIRIASKICSFPLHGGRAARFIARPKTVLIGDSAHLIHPLAGQGANLGLMDILHLLPTKSPAEQALLADDLTWHILKQYERKAQTTSLAMKLAVEAVLSLTKCSNSPTRRLMQTAFSLANLSMPIKRFFMDWAGSRPS